MSKAVPRSVMSGLVAAFVLCAPCADAQTYPAKPLRVLVGYPPGGPNDVTIRLIGHYLAEALGQQLVIDNRPGAGGTVALATLTQSAPDGYTISAVSNGETAIAPHLYKKLPYDPLRDTAPVTRVGAGQLALVIHPSVPAKSVSDLVAQAKGKPGSINFASAGTGSTAHLAGELFKHLAAVDIVHVPYKGAGPALTDLVGGQVQMLITGYSGAVPHIKAGKLRLLAVTGAKRLSAAPSVPTLDETVKGYEVTSWYGILAPAKTPRVIISRLHAEISAITRRPEVADRLLALGIEPEGNTPEEFRTQMRNETEKWGKLVKLAKVRIE